MWEGGCGRVGVGGWVEVGVGGWIEVHAGRCGRVD